MLNIIVADLEVFWCVGVTEEERARPQRLLISVDLAFDFSSAILAWFNKSIDPLEVAEMLLKYGEGRSTNLIGKLAFGIGNLMLTKFGPEAVLVEVKKFPVPHAAYVSVIWTGPK